MTSASSPRRRWARRHGDLTRARSGSRASLRERGCVRSSLRRGDRQRRRSHLGPCGSTGPARAASAESSASRQRGRPARAARDPPGDGALLRVLPEGASCCRSARRVGRGAGAHHAERRRTTPLEWGRRAARGRLQGRALGRRARLGWRRLHRRKAGSSRRDGHHRQPDRDVVLRRRKGLLEEGGLVLAGRTAARSDVGRARDQNEDRYVVREDRRATLLAVADGVGGEAGGETASAAAIETLTTRFFAASAELSRADALAAAMREANDAVLTAAGASGQKGAASTLVAAAVAKGEAVVANLGDSRAYLVHKGAIRRLTTDHTGPFPSSVTRFVGDPRGAQPDVFVESLEPGDRLVLCSDGLTRHLADQDIAVRAKGSDLKKDVDALVDLANERGGQDNITVVLYAVPSRFELGDLRHALISVILAILVLVVIAGAVAALIIASGAVVMTR
ncbi:MAG: serine/threonine-protein phosphatase [Chloroflexi bacterium]|nr:MAG: serine/threonine-protein phosphatase [Chloroflexota bacterium]